jgi:hypothetical protein
MTVKDSKGRECEIDFNSDAYDYFEITGGIYLDDKSEVPQDEIDWIADRYAGDIFEDIASNAADRSLDAWKAYSRGDSY